jgi:hypothetical protein
MRAWLISRRRSSGAETHQRDAVERRGYMSAGWWCAGGGVVVLASQCYCVVVAGARTAVG